tara:strand:- start:3369 stop:4043 length:675 start_codon:yes stop_codon:yes gene_type:complete
MIYDKKLLTDEQGSSDLIPKRIYADKVITLDNIAAINQRYMGAGMSQNFLAIPWFEYYLDAHQFEYIAEFGSQKGCLSTYFANYAGITEKVFFDTFELFPDKDWWSRPNEGAGHWFKKLAEISPYINYHHQDVFSKETIDHVSENIQEHKTFIFCDGGDKVKEFNTYAPLLKPGDCIAVHDWGVEIHMHQIEDTIKKYNLEVDHNFAQSAQQFGTWIMPFRRVK